MNKNSVSVLGKTFSNEEERRSYFKNELRRKLPELKKIEGFPIGEDEDIIKLSDPPYYTACPNPWVKELVEEKNAKNGKKHFEVKEPFAADVSSGKNNPIYNSHSYHTKVPHPAIMSYIMHYTKPGDIVLDGFAGTGMTGVAAQLCSNPDPEIRFEVESRGQNQNGESKKWGSRNVILNDLSPIASFTSYQFNKENLAEDFKTSAENLLQKVQHEFRWMYETKGPDGSKCKINFTVWSDVFCCKNCNEEMVFWDIAVNHDEKSVNSEFACPNCGTLNTKRSANRVKETIFDTVLNQSQIFSKQVPALINYTYNSKRHYKKPDKEDLDKINKINSLSIIDEVPIYKIPKGDKTGEPIRAGFSYVHQLYTKRNLIALSKINKLVTDSQCDRLRFWFNSTLPWTGKENRLHIGNYFNKKGGVITSLRGTWYISSLSVETNVFERFKLRIRSSVYPYKLEKENTIVTTQSASALSNFPKNSVDYIFTDPPFGKNLMYSELNVAWEAWLKVRTNNKQEAIENKSQGKGILEYTSLMTRSFKEYSRILKPGHWMTVVFSNTSASIWNSLQTSLKNSGFVVANVNALDKKKGSFNSVNNVTSVKQDLVISCYKPRLLINSLVEEKVPTSIWDFIEEHLNHLPVHVGKGKATMAINERIPKILFDRVVAFFIQKNLPVPIDAIKFREGLKERFIERDEMFFTEEQVQEYDRKKAEMPEFIQLSILVSSEQDGILWLKNQLQEKEQTYQDIHPQWMQALAGVRKGDIIPELSDILEENFLKNASGKWYVPDPENEADLEKLRNKRLLRQYDEYKKEALKLKGKIKEVRIEALRAGFKQDYQDKDFKSIVTVGDKIPNQLLMEDEVLLQFYDIAASRV